MTVGIVGLGLIGGSLAKAYKKAGWRVLVYNRTKSVEDFAVLQGTADGKLDPVSVGECDLIHIALYPEASVKWLKENAAYIKKDALVTDDCGTKRMICSECFPIAEIHGFIFFGGHPMAGTHFSGYKYSKADMFRGASMIVVPPEFDDIRLLERIKGSLSPLGLSRVAMTTAENHDRMIAYTSQLAHIVSNAYIKSPSAQAHKGYSAGSFRDLTRVARLNENMWTELFLENADNLTFELSFIIDRLNEYKTAIEKKDAGTLCRLLREGREAKEKSEE